MTAKRSFCAVSYNPDFNMKTVSLKRSLCSQMTVFAEELSIAGSTKEKKRESAKEHGRDEE